ncbi:unnamed protein product [Heligmosomoides polygyrus]|uniref:HTH psq-type domain-containing protein n=1 Tax=Heligmosomoides polygyrus TaxID=6339 RepID=A0A3P7YIR5_HELPZ|nr:unnamed protein product [Heligmosomoides polygyrus]
MHTNDGRTISQLAGRDEEEVASTGVVRQQMLFLKGFFQLSVPGIPVPTLTETVNIDQKDIKTDTKRAGASRLTQSAETAASSLRPPKPQARLSCGGAEAGSAYVKNGKERDEMNKYAYFEVLFLGREGESYVHEHRLRVLYRLASLALQYPVLQLYAQISLWLSKVTNQFRFQYEYLLPLETSCPEFTVFFVVYASRFLPINRPMAAVFASYINRNPGYFLKGFRDSPHLADIFRLEVFEKMLTYLLEMEEESSDREVMNIHTAIMVLLDKWNNTIRRPLDINDIPPVHVPKPAVGERNLLGSIKTPSAKFQQEPYKPRKDDWYSFAGAGVGILLTVLAVPICDRILKRKAVTRLAESGESTTAIARKPSIPLRTVQRIIKQWNEKGNVTIKVKSGRPRSVNTTKNRVIIEKRIDINDSISLNKIAKSLEIACCTVQPIVRNELGLRSYRLLNGQQLTKAAKENREKKCKGLLRLFSARRVAQICCGQMRKFSLSKSHTMLSMITCSSDPIMDILGKGRSSQNRRFPKD